MKLIKLSITLSLDSYRYDIGPLIDKINVWDVGLVHELKQE